MEGSGSGQIITDPDPGGPKTHGSYGSPAPEHCILQTNRELEATPRARVSDPDPHPDPH
jgi:hypothetical protein